MFLSARTYNFRNLKDEERNIEAENIYLIGENGQGKSNFLEMIYILCFGSSFRTKQEKFLIRRGEESMMAEGVFLDRDDIKNNISFKIENGKKEIKQNGKNIYDRKDLIENIPCIVYKHEDIYIVNGTPDKRRLFFNQTIGMYDILFLETLRDYNKILKMRNNVLKERKIEYLPVLNRQLIDKGLKIQKKRKNISGEFNILFSEVFKEVTKSDMFIKLFYSPSWSSEDPGEILEKMEKEQDADVDAGITFSGPHRDRFYFYMENRDFSKMASTGQSRLIALAMRNAQAHFYKSKTGRKPVLLIDDVLLELDKNKRIRFIKSLPEYEQAFFTYLPGEEIISERGREKFYNVKEGELKEYENSRRNN